MELWLLQAASPAATRGRLLAPPAVWYGSYGFRYVMGYSSTTPRIQYHGTTRRSHLLFTRRSPRCICNTCAWRDICCGEICLSVRHRKSMVLKSPDQTLSLFLESSLRRICLSTSNRAYVTAVSAKCFFRQLLRIRLSLDDDSCSR